MKRFLLYLVTLIVPFVVVSQQTERPQYVVFQVTPKTATVVVGGKSVAPDGEGIAMLMLNNGSYNYSVSAKDYHSESGTFVVSGAKVVKNVKLRPAHGWLSVSNSKTPSGAKVYIDGTYIGQVPFKSDRIPSGIYTVRIEHEKYEVFESKIYISDGEIDEYSPQLTPRVETPRVGTLNVMSTPAMAGVYVDGKLVGQTPLMLDLIIGKHEVKVFKGNLGVEPQTVTIAEGKTENLNLTLVEVKPKNKDFVETVKGLNMKMIFVEGGTFQMGATSEQGRDVYEDEKPVHSVTLDSYYIAETEVTQAQWRAIMGTNPSYFSGDNRPVEQVSWYDAQEFCEKLSQLTGKTYTLPTEAQWEYAARGYNMSIGYRYSGSDYIGDVAWYHNNSISHACSVKQRRPNELGLYDMSGNVFEWCSDWYGDYSSSSQTNPTGPSSGGARVVRGGGWNCDATYCRVSKRSYDGPSYRICNLGFRVVCLP